MSGNASYELSPKALEESTISHAPNTTRTSIDTVSEDLERERENARHGNPNGFSRTESGVNVKEAEAQFATLQRELSGISQTSRRLSKTNSRASARKNVSEKDVEKTASSDSTTEEPFDLESTLRGNHSVSNFRTWNRIAHL